MAANKNPHVPHPAAHRDQMPEWKLILRELEFGPTTTKDIAAVIKRCERTAWIYLREMEKRELVRVCGFERTEGQAARIYCLADGKRPAIFHPMNSYERVVRSRDRQRERRAVLWGDNV